MHTNASTASGVSYTLDRELSSGGEAVIYTIREDQNLLAKVYHQKRLSAELFEKISYMVNHRPSDDSVLAQTAWPMDLLYDGNKSFTGFVMRRLNVSSDLKAVNRESSLNNRITLQQKLIIAQNTCAVLANLQKSGYIIGDLKPENIGVSLTTGRVAFFDIDSLHLVTSRKTYRCCVATPGYIAPELLHKAKLFPGMDFANMPLPTFTQETDAFALAEHVFGLLNNGIMPFTGVSAGSSAASRPSPGNEDVYNGRYVHKKGLKPYSPLVPPLDTHPGTVQRLFERAFIQGMTDPGRRPTAAEWYQALEEYENMLKTGQCGHQYQTLLRECPWCKVNAAYRKRMKPFATPVKQCSQKSFATSVRLPSTNRYSVKSNKTVFEKTSFYAGMALMLAVMILILAGSAVLKDSSSHAKDSVQVAERKAADTDEPPAHAYCFEPLEEVTWKAEDGFVIGDAEPCVYHIGSNVFANNTNEIYFIPPVTGRYRIEVTSLKMPSPRNHLTIRAFNRSARQMAKKMVFHENEGFTLKNLQQGEPIIIRAEPPHGDTTYEVIIACQKEMQDISETCTITDTVQYTDQRNVYLLSPGETGEYAIRIDGMADNSVLEAAVFDDKTLSETTEITTMLNGTSLRVYLHEGRTYQVQVRQSVSFTPYTVSIY